MKTRLIAFLILLAFLVEVRGFVPGETTNSIPIGSLSVVSNYCLKTGKDLTLFIQQYDSNGVRQTYLKKGVTGTMPSTEVMDLVMTNLLGDGIQELIAHPEYGHDLSRPFGLFAIYSFTHDSDIYFECNYNFSLVKVGSTYKAPDLSGARMVFPKRIPYKFYGPLIGFPWIHVEVTNHLNSTFRVDDSRLGSTNIQTIRSGNFRLMVPYLDAISANGTNVSVRINILNSTNNQFEVYENGQQVAERQPKMAITYIDPMQSFMTARSRGFMGPQPQSPTSPIRNFFIEPPSFILKVTDGEIGRTYRILTTTSVNEPYTDTNSRHRVTPTSSTTSMTLEVFEGNRFFQVQSIDVAPTY